MAEVLDYCNIRGNAAHSNSGIGPDYILQRRIYLGI